MRTLWDFIYKTGVIIEIDVRKLRHDPVELLTRAIQPVLWLLIFGQVFTQVRAFPTGNLSYLDFMAPGILAQSVLFIAIFAGISIIWERDLGIAHKFLVSPAPRGSLVLGKALAAGVRGLTQGFIIYILALILGVHINPNPLAILGVAFTAVLGAAVFSTFSLIIAILVKSRERFLGVGQILTMPFFFASNAIYPIDIMPVWLQWVARVNPLTYIVNILRSLMIVGGTSDLNLGIDFAILIGITAILVIIAARLYPRITN
jgi:ABC-2 type transport system permease protein